MRRVITYTITTKEDGMTVMSYLKSKHYSRQCIVDLKHHECGIFHNGRRAYVNETLASNDTLQITWEDVESSEKIPPINIPLEILYEDEDLVVINKPADMPIHPSLNNYENTLANGLAYVYENEGDKFVFRCMNRLDRHTSGTVLVAKNGISGAILSEMVRERRIDKEYVALVEGSIKENKVNITQDNDAFIIDAPIGRVDGSTIERCIDYENGKRAVTRFRIEKYIEKENVSLVCCHLETGRTHQIRVHMAHIGHPLLGDFLYNPENRQLNRQALHCRKIAFIHPITGEKVEINAPLPKEWDDILNAVERP